MLSTCFALTEEVRLDHCRVDALQPIGASSCIEAEGPPARLLEELSCYGLLTPIINYNN